MASQIIQPARTLDGAVRPPGDKSISHRCALLAGVADGVSAIENYSTGADCASTLSCLEALGVGIVRTPEKLEITGVGLHGFRAPGGMLDAGNSGSTMRMLAGLLAGRPFDAVMTGDDSLRGRPMRRVIEPLGLMGAMIRSRDGRPPLEFVAGTAPLRAIEYQLPVASAQVKTALLLAGLRAHGTMVVEEPLATRDHTEIALERMGVNLHRRRGRITLTGPVATLTPSASFRIPGDPSSAAFFLCAAALFPEASVLVDEVALNPRRSALLDVLARMGAGVEVTAVEDRGGELVGSLHCGGPRPGGLRGTTISGGEAVALMDEIPILAVLATAAEGGIQFEDVGELRVKESDRIEAIATNLRAMGAECATTATSLTVGGRQALRGARVESFHDHRIAMAFSIAALGATGATEIANAECVAISYPEFFATLERIAER